MTNGGDLAYWYKRFKEEQMKAEALMKHSERVYQEGYRAGIEKVTQWVRRHSSPSEEEWCVLLDQKAFDEFVYQLLKEAGDDV